jgi:hypothetical protein
LFMGAKDLPRTVLSDHIEDRLFKRLKQEKKDHAAAAGKSIDEVSDTVQLLQEKQDHASNVYLSVFWVRPCTQGCPSRCFVE